MITIQLFPQTFLFMFLVIFIITALFYIMHKQHKITLWFLGILEIYILFIFSTGILPIRMPTSDRIVEYNLSDSIQLIPFQSISHLIKNNTLFNRQIIGNLILLFPLPIFLGFLNKNRKYISLFLLSFLSSIMLETLQLFINLITKYPSRIIDIDDIILNTTGIIAGLVVFIIIKKIPVLYKWISTNIVYKTNFHI
ncbi:VanZ family protein [[Clostridium] polysaccharolyticum]|uniref:VanZ like family protein n=1 Tax=[Clostridium] polysaccharolyticum TaxID=29364 RepID=A0A1I0D9I3_9FIRM|nr:VanZ family protein [[Clostridium] polysaccharolyticum]SET28182.1 VanZ like family protein [[Clostridium] polysaccharolyticum]